MTVQGYRLAGMIQPSTMFLWLSVMVACTIVHVTSMNLTDVDVALDMCSLAEPCPASQSCVHVPQIGFICKCKEGFVGLGCITECSAIPADIVFLLDSSVSIVDMDWKKMLRFVVTFVEHLQVDEGVHRIGVISFANEARIDMRLDDYSTTQDIVEKIKNLDHREGLTNIAHAVNLMRTDIFKGSQRMRIGILVTDGFSTLGEDMVEEESRLTKAAGIIMFVIAIGEEVKLTELELLASEKASDHMHLLDDFKALSDVLNHVIESTCHLVPTYKVGTTGATGSTGLPGPRGVSGSVGINGPPGSPGARGAHGYPGSSGSTGRPGVDGHAGGTGHPGFPGLQGQPGVRGPAGIHGDKGDHGHPGPPMPGRTGLPGLRGVPGPFGAAGPLGLLGSPGYYGDVGFPGQVGLTGATGRNGNYGQPGPAGIQGPPGLPGERGPQGGPGPTGYIYEDADDCALNIHQCQHTCINKRKGYGCECHPGYQLHADGSQCEEIDECSLLNGGCEHVCTNTEGSFICSCTVGYTTSNDDKTCIDVDECCPDQLPHNPCPDTHRCINTMGSYSCILTERLPRSESGDQGPDLASSKDSFWVSILLNNNMVISIFIWLCVLTLLTVIIVILASSTQPSAIYIRNKECPPPTLLTATPSAHKLGHSPCTSSSETGRCGARAPHADLYPHVTVVPDVSHQLADTVIY